MIMRLSNLEEKLERQGRPSSRVAAKIEELKQGRKEVIEINGTPKKGKMHFSVGHLEFQQLSDADNSLE